MALLDDVRLVCRVSSTVADAELQAGIDAALADMERVGINSELLKREELSPLAKQAVFNYCRQAFGLDNNERTQFYRMYKQTVIDLLNSSANIAAEDSE